MKIWLHTSSPSIPDFKVRPKTKEKWSKNGISSGEYLITARILAFVCRDFRNYDLDELECPINHAFSKVPSGELNY